MLRLLSSGKNKMCALGAAMRKLIYLCYSVLKGRLSVSLFRYGLDYVQMAILRLIGFGKKEEFKKVLAILRKKKPDRTRIL